jgi:hypothetical protein
MSSKYVHHKGPEARLYLGCVASVALPTGMLIFAWTARPDVLWIVPLVGLTVSSNRSSILLTLIYLLAFYGLCFRHISSCVCLLGRLVNVSSFLFFRMLTSHNIATGPMHLRPWQVRVCVVSPLRPYIRDRI